MSSQLLRGALRLLLCGSIGWLAACASPREALHPASPGPLAPTPLPRTGAEAPPTTPPVPLPAATTASAGSEPSYERAYEPRPVDERQARCLALSMYWEAKGEGREGMRAVGHVVLNRVAHSAFPDTPCDVIYDGGEQPPCQFSWYCDGRSDEPREPGPYRESERLAIDLLSGRLEDTTDGALFYHASRLRTPWRVPRTRTVRIGRHVFYK